MRKLCLDIGSVRIGVARSDYMNIIASPLEVYTRTKSIKNDAKYIANLVKETEVDEVVVGLPLNMNGTAGPSVEMIKTFVQELQNYTDVKIVFQDERLSTVSAEKILIESNMRRDKRKTVIDKIAATIILQNYLDKISKR